MCIIRLNNNKGILIVLFFLVCSQGSKCTSGGAPGQPYYMTHQFPPGSSATLPNRGRPPTGSIPARAYSPAVPPVVANKSSGNPQVDYI